MSDRLSKILMEKLLHFFLLFPDDPSAVNALSISLDEVPQQFQGAVESLHCASKSLRSCYVTSDSSITEFKEFRNEIRDLALIFKDGLFPASEALVSHLNGFMDYYDSLSFLEWSENLEEILKDADMYSAMLTIVTRSYQCIQKNFKTKQDDTTKLVKQIELKHALQLQEEARRMRQSERADWGAFWMKIVTFGITDNGFAAVAAEELAKAVAAGAEATLAVAAINDVHNHLIPGIDRFVAAMCGISGFFNLLTNNVRALHNQGAGEARKKVHYLMMKKKAASIKQSSEEFLMASPVFISDLMCLPCSDRPNHVQDWLAQQTISDHLEAAPLLPHWRPLVVQLLSPPVPHRHTSPQFGGSRQCAGAHGVQPQYTVITQCTVIKTIKTVSYWQLGR